MSRQKLLTSFFIFYAILQYAETCNQNNKAKCDELMQKNHLQVGSMCPDSTMCGRELRH